MLDVITPHGACLVLASINLKKWGGRAQVVSFIAAHEDWCQVSTEALAQVTALKRPYLQRLARYLVTERVLERLPGRGTRPNAYRLQSDITAWAGVPWTVPPELLAHRVEKFHDEHQRAARTADDLLAARSHTARVGVVAARSYTARGSSLVARHANARLAPGQAGYPRVPGARDNDGLGARHGNARVEPGARKKGFPLSEGEGSDDDLASLGGGSAEQRREITGAEEGAAVRSVQRHAGAAYVRGVVLQRLLALFDSYGHADVLAALGHVPANTGIKSLLDDLAIECAVGGAGRASSGAEVVDLDCRRRAEGLRRQIALYEADGSPVPDSLLAELAECENGPTPGGT